MSSVSMVSRPQRWDVPFSDEVTDADVERLLQQPPFRDIDRSRFRGSVTLEGILRNDAAIRRCQAGDIIVREGDWGNSAFFILSGAVRVELEPPERALPAEVLGRRKVKRKSVFRAIAQLWSNHAEPEFRDVSSKEGKAGVGLREDGTASRIYLRDVPAVLDQYRTARIEAGQFFGEIAALGRMPRTATVFSEGESVLLEMRWQGLRDIMRRDSALKRHIEENFRERVLATFLRNTPMFAHLSDVDLGQIVQQAEFDTFGTYDSAQPFRDLVSQGNAMGIAKEPVIAEEGDYPNGVILVCSGLARMSQRYYRGHRTVGYLTGGHVYGFEEIREAWETSQQVPLRYSLRAIGYLTAVLVPTVLIEKFVLGKRPKPSRAVKASGTSRPQMPDGRSPGSPAADDSETGIGSGLLEFLMDNRYVQGTATMVIDLDRCTRCDDCVRACANAHDNNPRFLRHGPSYGRYMVANACMHCLDPVCMIECPTGAIHRDLRGGQVVINERTCIGCTACAQNCPYDAIRMVEIRDGAGQLILDEMTRYPLQQATKCDLCVDQFGGPACQNACPHDALARVNLTELKSLGDVFQR